MSRYIDADAIKEKIDDIWDGRPLSFLGARILAMIDDAPSIDIVRCKECRYKDMEICPMYRLVVAGVRKHDDFCSYGERREP